MRVTSRKKEISTMNNIYAYDIMAKNMTQLFNQYGGGGIPFSAMKQKRSKRRSTTRRNKRRSTTRRNKRTTRRRNQRSTTRRNKRTTRRRSTRRRSTRRKRSTKGSTKHSHKKSGKCKCGTHSYTGKEQTPRGFGHCDECISLNVIIKGTDGVYYENQKEKGWTKIN